MPEQEELRLVVTLDDQASAQLGALRSNLSSLSSQINQAFGGGTGGGTGGGGITGAAAGANKAVGGLHSSLTHLASRAGFIGGVVSGITSELTKMGTELVKRATDFEGMAREMVEFSNTARSMGTSMAELRANLQGFRESGVGMQQAQSALEGVADAMARINTLNDPLQMKLMTGNFMEMGKMQEMIARARAETTLTGQVKVLREMVVEARKYGEIIGDPQFAARQVRILEGLFNAKGLENMTEAAKELAKWQEQLDEQREATHRRFIKESGEQQYVYERIGRSIGYLGIKLLDVSGISKEWLRTTEALSYQLDRSEKLMAMSPKERADFFKQGLTPKGQTLIPGAQGDIPDTYGQLRFNMWANRRFNRGKGGEPLLNPDQPLSPGTPKGQGWWEGATVPNVMNPNWYFGNTGGGGAQRFGNMPWSVKPGSEDKFDTSGLMTPENIARGGKRIEFRDVEGNLINKDNAQKTEENTQELKRLNDAIIYSQQPRPVGGDMAAALGMGALTGGGGATRFPGGGSGPGIGSGGSTTDSGGAATHAGGAGGGAAGTPGISAGTASGSATYQKMLAAFKGSSLIGKVPPGGARFGITTGSAEEWARFGTAVAKAESSFNPRSANTSDPGGSFGILQYAHNQVPGGNAYDVDKSIEAFVRDAEKGGGKYSAGVGPGSLLAARFSTIGSHPERTVRNLANYDASGAPAAGTAAQPGQAVSFAGSGQPVSRMTEGMAPAGTRPGTGAPGGLTTFKTSSGRNITVASDYAANFQGFLADYEAAGGRAGPDTGGLGSRPGNASYHPRGMAIDLNQIGYGVRSRGGVTLPQATEDALAAKWGLFPGSQFRSRSDIGHFEVRNREAALAAQQRNQQGIPANAQPTQGQGIPVNVVNMTPQAAQQYMEAQQKANASIATTAASATAAAIKAGATPEQAAAAGAAAATAAHGTAPKPPDVVAGPKPDPIEQAQTAVAAKEARERAQEDAEVARLEEIERKAAVRREERGLSPEQRRERRRQEREAKEEEKHTQEGEKLQADAERRDAKQAERTKKAADRQEKVAERSRQRIFRDKYGRTIPFKNMTNQQKIDYYKQKREREDREAEAKKVEEEYRTQQKTEAETKLRDSTKSIEELEEEADRKRDPEGYIDRQLAEQREREGKTPLEEAEERRQARRGRDPVSGFSGKGDRLDSAPAVKVQSDGTLKVDVNAPPNTTVVAKGSGGFKKTITDRHSQMTPAPTGPDHDPSLDS